MMLLLMTGRGLAATPCIILTDQGLFDFSSLSQTNPLVQDGYSLAVEFCKPLTCPLSTEQAVATLTYPNGTCVSSASSPFYALVEVIQEDSSSLLKLNFSSGLPLHLNLTCGEQFILNRLIVSEQMIQVQGLSQFGCSQKRLSFLEYLYSRNIYLSSGLLGAAGIFLLLFGLRMVKPTCFILGFVLSLTICLTAIQKNFSDYSVLSLYFLGLLMLVVAAIAGYIAMFVPAIAIAINCVFAANLIALLFYQISHFIYWALTVLLTLLALYCAFREYRLLIICSTALTGSSFFFRALQNVIQGSIFGRAGWQYGVPMWIAAAAGAYYQYVQDKDHRQQSQDYSAPQQQQLQQRSQYKQI